MKRARLFSAPTDSIIDFARLMVLTVRRLASMKPPQDCETSFYSHIIYLYQLTIRAIYGNELLSKVKLMNERGFAMKLEEIDEKYRLNLFGVVCRVKQVDYIRSIIKGGKNSDFVSLGFAAQLLDHYLEIAEGENIASVRNQLLNTLFEAIMRAFDGKRENSVASEEDSAVSFLDLLTLARKKYHRNTIISSTVNLLIDAVRRNNEEYMALFRGKTFSIRLPYGEKKFLCNSLTAENGIQRLKFWLKTLTFDEVKNDWALMFSGDYTDPEESRLILVKAILDDILIGVEEYYQKDGFIDLQSYINDNDMFARLLCSDYPLFDGKNHIRNFKIWELLPSIQSIKQYIIVVFAYVLFNGNIPKCVAKMRESVTKSLPYKITCSQLIFTTGLFASATSFKLICIVPQRCVLKGNFFFKIEEFLPLSKRPKKQSKLVALTKDSRKRTLGGSFKLLINMDSEKQDLTFAYRPPDEEDKHKKTMTLLEPRIHEKEEVTPKTPLKSSTLHEELVKNVPEPMRETFNSKDQVEKRKEPLNSNLDEELSVEDTTNEEHRVEEEEHELQENSNDEKFTMNIRGGSEEQECPDNQLGLELNLKKILRGDSFLVKYEEKLLQSNLTIDEILFSEKRELEECLQELIAVNALTAKKLVEYMRRKVKNHDLNAIKQ